LIYIKSRRPKEAELCLIQKSKTMRQINLNAPVQCRREIIINAGIERTWQTLSDINAWPHWNPAISKARLKGEMVPGSTFEWKTGGVGILSTLHAAEAYKNLGWTGKAPGVFAIHNWKISDHNGKTKVEVEESMEGILASLFKRSFARNLEQGMEKWLQLLKDKCEVEPE
jgi:hypothetical protein